MSLVLAAGASAATPRFRQGGEATAIAARMSFQHPQRYRANLVARAAAQSGAPVLTSVPVPTGAPGSWQMRFSDEFNGTSLNLATWNPNWFGRSTTLPSGTVNGPVDQSCNAPQQLSEANGTLAIGIANRACTTDNGQTFAYAGGLLNTWDKYWFTYGFMEARIFIPTNAAGEPVDSVSFWADGRTWPTTGELDVMEVLRGCGPHGTAGFGYHFHNSAGAFGHCASMTHLGGWHTFGADWEPGSVTYYYDGREVGRLTNGITAAPMYLILAAGVDPTDNGPTLTPATALVDYVRVWQH